MSRFADGERQGLDDLIAALKQQRDELALKLNLGKAELRDEWNAVNDRLLQLSKDYEPLKQATGEAAGDVWESLKRVGEEIKNGLNKIRKSI